MLRLALAGLALAPAAFAAQNPNPVAPPHFEFEQIVGGLHNLTDFVPLEGGSILLARQLGEVVLAGPDGTLQGTVLDIRADVSGGFDRGLLSIAVHPGFVPDAGPTSWLYAYYSAGPDQANGLDGVPILGELARHRIDTVLVGGVPVLRAVPGSKEVLLGGRLPDGTAPTAVPLLHESHLGGALAFGADGTLLLSTGDGASFLGEDFGGQQPWGFDDFVHPTSGLKGPWPKAQDQGRFRAQQIDSLSGKVLRLDPETGFGVPSNPFFDGDPTSRRSRVWALGLRNPFRMALVPGTGASDPAVGDPGWLWIADVGHSGWEELDLARGGENFGWPCFEGHGGFNPGQSYVPPANPYGWFGCGSLPLPVTAPELSVPRTNPSWLTPSGLHQDLSGQPLGGFLGICIVGGAVYDGTSYPPAYHGRYVFGDFGHGWLEGASLDANGDLDNVVDWGSGFFRMIGAKVEPATRDLLLGFGGHEGNPSGIYALRYGVNALPFAVFVHAIAPGGDPFTLQFDASGTTDADGDALTFTWDFGDGATGEGMVVVHKFASAAPHVVRLVVDDGFGESSIELPVLPGLAGPAIAIASPQQGLVVEPGEQVVLSAVSVDAGGAPLDVEWSIDLFEDGGWALDHLTFSGATALVEFGPEPSPGADWGWRVRARAFDSGTAVAEDVVHVHPAARVRDVAGTAQYVAKVLTLSPAGSQGFGSKDPEVWRDGVVPLPGAPASEQYATYHPGGPAASSFDWIGYELASDVPAGSRLFALEFTEGLHVPEGGWFLEQPVVQVRIGGVWQNAADVACTPPYSPLGAGADFATYRFAFAPVVAEAVRLIGRPGGTERFLSVAELRAVTVGPPGPWRDVTDLASAPLADTLELLPPGPQGFGAFELERLRDGSAPAPGSASVLAQVTSYHPNATGDLAWFGWRFDDATTLTAARFTEGVTWSAGSMPIGGWFASIAVETRLHADDAWTPVDASTVSPPYRSPGPAGLDYETYEITFAPRVARELRVVGPPAGLFAFASAAELRVFGPHGFAAGWSARPGLGLPGDVLTLSSTTPPVLGMPVLLEASGATPNAPALLAISAGAATLPLGDVTVLIDPASVVLVPAAFDADGILELALPLPSDASFAGASFAFQVAAALTGGIAASNALDAVLGAQ